MGLHLLDQIQRGFGRRINLVSIELHFNLESSIDIRWRVIAGADPADKLLLISQLFYQDRAVAGSQNGGQKIQRVHVRTALPNRRETQLQSSLPELGKCRNQS